MLSFKFKQELWKIRFHPRSDNIWLTFQCSLEFCRSEYLSLTKVNVIVISRWPFCAIQIQPKPLCNEHTFKPLFRFCKGLSWFAATCNWTQQFSVAVVCERIQQLPTTCNRVYKRTQHVSSNNDASVCMRLETIMKLYRNIAFFMRPCPFCWRFVGVQSLNHKSKTVCILLMLIFSIWSFSKEAKLATNIRWYFGSSMIKVSCSSRYRRRRWLDIPCNRS